MSSRGAVAHTSTHRDTEREANELVHFSQFPVKKEQQHVACHIILKDLQIARKRRRTSSLVRPYWAMAAAHIKSLKAASGLCQQDAQKIPISDTIFKDAFVVPKQLVATLCAPC